MGDLLSEFGDLVFTLVIGYIGAIELLYVVRHLYHWSFNHEGSDNENDADSLARLQDHLRDQLANAKAVEDRTGKSTMQDGVAYQDGFRIDPNQADIDRLIEQLKDKSLSYAKRQELEKELAKQKKIGQQTRKALEEAEAAYARQQREKEENERKMLEAERQREREEKRRAEENEAKRKAEEEEQRKREDEERKADEEAKRKAEEEEQQRKEEEIVRQQKEAEENARQLLEVEQAREREQRKREEEEEAERQRQAAADAEREQRRRTEEEEAKRQRQAAEDAERAENQRRILEAEREMAEAQRKAEEEAENERKFLEMERKLEQEMMSSEYEEELTDNERRLIESIKQRDIAEQQDEATTQKEAEFLKRILQAREQLGEESEEEQSQRLFALEQDHEMKQRRIEENARLFLEAEKELANIQERMHEAVEKREFSMNLDSAPQSPVVEEPCIKKTILPLRDGEHSPQPMAHRVKTQLAQSSDDSYSVSTKSLLFPGVSDDASSNEPISSQQSSFSTQPSEDVTNGTESQSQYPPQERQEPDGEDTTPAQQYSDDYLRSLDGIKQRPLSREDGSGRRRAFKKRRSSGSSNSSFESKASREEELKMFTSLEEEEMQNSGQSEFTSIRYTSEPTLKVKGHHRRHKRSPAKDVKSGEDSQRSSLERLGEETINPWGDVVPEHYKQTEFWKREKALSIEEEHELEKLISSEEVNYDTAANLPNASSFEEATKMQNEEAITNLKKQDNKDTKEEESGVKTTTDETTRSDNNSNLQTSSAVEKQASPARSPVSPLRLRRSPRIEEMDQYEERWKESFEPPNTAAPSSTMNTPRITVDKPLDFGSWRDEHGLIMEGLSDFYDFTASVNPSRSRSTSRNPSPANTAPGTPVPKNVAFEVDGDQATQIEVYDDTDQLQDNDITKENIVKFIDSLNADDTLATDQIEAIKVAPSSLKDHLKYVIDDQSREKGANSLVPLVNVLENPSAEAAAEVLDGNNNEDMNSLVASLRAQRVRSRSRSKSPLPTTSNIQRSLESRRHKMIKHNEDILEKLIESKMLPETPDPTTAPIEKENDESSKLHKQRSSSSSRSRSRSRSPLPTADNIQRSLEHRRQKRIQDNDEFFEKLSAQMNSPEGGPHSPLMFNPAHIAIEVTGPVFSNSLKGNEKENGSGEEMESLIQSLRVNRSRTRSKSPMRSTVNENPISGFETISIEITESEPIASSKADEDEGCSRQEMESLVQSLRAARSRSRSRTPMRQPANVFVPISIEITESEPTTSKADENDQCSRQEMESLVQSLRAARSRSRSRTPMRQPVSENPVSGFAAVSIEITQHEPTNLNKTDEEQNCSRQKMEFLDQSLWISKSRSRSKSPMRLPTEDNLSKSLEVRRSKLIERNDEIKQQLEEKAKTPEPPPLTVQYVYEFVETSDETHEKYRLSRSKSPSRSPPLVSRSSEINVDTFRSRSPSRSLSPTKDQECLDLNFHVLLNLEGSYNKTLLKNSEEHESTLADRQRRLDKEALDKLKNASEEVELRTLSPLVLDPESRDLLSKLPDVERSKLLRCSPTTPDYDRTISEEMRDVERIKREMLESGFKRSTYVGESMDLGSEYESFRREAAHFQRSRSPTPSVTEIESEQMMAAEKRQLQDLVLAELTGTNETRNTGAVPKTDRVTSTSTDSEASLAREVQDTLRIKEEMLSSGFQRSTYIGESVDDVIDSEERRWRRSPSRSRSPVSHAELTELDKIDMEVARRGIQDTVLDALENTSMNFQDFSRHLNPSFFDDGRRASDSALIQKPEILIQFQDSDLDIDMEPEEYHHFRRFSLAQESPSEEYPSDDYIFIQQVEVRTRSGSRTWTREDFYSQDISDFLVKDRKETSQSPFEIITMNEKGLEEPSEESAAGQEGTTYPGKVFSESNMENQVEQEETAFSGKASPESTLEEHATVSADNEVVGDDNLEGNDDDEDSNGSDDRRTVIEVEDEIDEDISDFNERGPAEESHHEQSECEEAEREMDRYAGREARDWDEVVDVEDIFAAENESGSQNEDSEGAVGGGNSNSPYDSDSFAIDQIYDEAIKNRKQSGILREFDSILNEMTNSFIESSNKDMDDQYALWSKTHKKPKNVEFDMSFIESERKDTEIRYLGDAAISARQSARLRSRYGYNPVLQTSAVTDNIQVDLNYRPKREYNWRKNFRLDDDEQDNTKSVEKSLIGSEVEWDLEESNNTADNVNTMELRKFSLGGESITIFSQSPEKELHVDDFVAYKEDKGSNITEEVNDIEPDQVEKPKKKKTKKKTRKGSKASIEMESLNKDDDADDSYMPSYSRRSSSIQMDTDSPKRKSRSRRSSRASLTNEDSFGICSPRGSVGYAESIVDIVEEYSEVNETARPKKIKKRKKAKETMANVTESSKEELLDSVESEEKATEAIASAAMTPDSNILSTFSPQDSVCGTPASLESETSVQSKAESKPTSAPSSCPTTPVDSFDILKDANFYPLF